MANGEYQAKALIIPSERVRALMIAEAELGERIMRAPAAPADGFQPERAGDRKRRAGLRSDGCAESPHPPETVLTAGFAGEPVGVRALALVNDVRERVGSISHLP